MYNTFLDTFRYRRLFLPLNFPHNDPFLILQFIKRERERREKEKLPPAASLTNVCHNHGRVRPKPGHSHGLQGLWQLNHAAFQGLHCQEARIGCYSCYLNSSTSLWDAGNLTSRPNHCCEFSFMQFSFSGFSQGKLSKINTECHYWSNC